MLIVLGLYSRIWILFLHQSAPSVRSPCNPTNREVAQLSNDTVGAARLIPMGNNHKQRCGSESSRIIYARTNEGKITLILSYCVMNGFIMFDIIFMTALHWRIRHSHLTSRQFHGLVPWWRPRKIRPQRTRISQSENSAMGTWPIYKNFYAILVRKMALKFWYMT